MTSRASGRRTTKWSQLLSKARPSLTSPSQKAWYLSFSRGKRAPIETSALLNSGGHATLAGLTRDRGGESLLRLDPAPPFLPDSAQAPTIGEANDDVLPACSPLKSLSNCPGPLNAPLHSVNQLTGLVSLGQRSGPQSPGLNPTGRPCAQAPSRALVEQAPFEPSKPKAAAN